MYRRKKNQTSTPHTQTCLTLLYSIDVKLLHYLVNSCQNKFGLFDQFTWQKKSEGSAQREEVYFSVNFYSPESKKTNIIMLLQKLLRRGFCPIMSHYSQNPITYVHIYWRSLRKNHGMLHFKCADSESCSSRKWTKVSLQNGAAEENLQLKIRQSTI